MKMSLRDSLARLPLAVSLAAILPFAGFAGSEGFPLVSDGKAVTVAFENDYARLTLDERGSVASLVEKKSARELIAKKAPFVFVEKADGTRLEPVSLKAAEADGVTRLDFGFAGSGHVRIDVSPFAKGTGWNVTLHGCDMKEAEWLTFVRIAPVCAAKRGKMSNIVMDGTSAVAIRAYDMQCEMDVRGAPGHIYVNNGENRTKQAVRHPIGEGTFEPLPPLQSGTTEFTVASEVSGARVTFFKRYSE